MPVAILDSVVTLLWVYWVWILLLSVLIGFIGMIIVEERKIKFPPKVVIGITLITVIIPFFSFFFVNFINPYFLGFGYATDNFEVVSTEENVLWGVDHWILSGGETGGISPIIYRIQGVNLDTGEKLFRRSIENQFEVVGNTEHLVWASTGRGIIGMNVVSGKTEITLNEKTLMKNFPELSKGVYTFDFNPKTSLLDVVSKDGLKITIDPVKNIKIDQRVETIIKSPFELRDYRISENNKTLLSLENEIPQKLIGQNSNILNKELTFLGGKFLLFDQLSRQALILSYETLDKENFILRLVSMEGKLLWEVKQHDLKVGDFFVPNPQFEKAFFSKNKIILAFYGFVFSLNVSDGSLNWVTRM